MPPPEAPPLPESAIEERFLAATGPGGQNVNKVATAAQVRLDVYALGLDPGSFKRLKLLAGSRWIEGGVIQIVARRFRTREANREDARKRLSAMVAEALIAPEKRIKTKPSKAAKARRMEGKAQRSTVKQGRGKVSID